MDPVSSSTISMMNNCSPAERCVREIATKFVGMSKTESSRQILDKVCDRMRSEFVIEEWQLSGLDSYQWKLLDAPVGLAVAVQQLSRGIPMANKSDSVILQDLDRHNKMMQAAMRELSQSSLERRDQEITEDEGVDESDTQDNTDETNEERPVIDDDSVEEEEKDDETNSEKDTSASDIENDNLNDGLMSDMIAMLSFAKEPRTPPRGSLVRLQSQSDQQEEQQSSNEVIVDNDDKEEEEEGQNADAAMQADDSTSVEEEIVEAEDTDDNDDDNDNFEVIQNDSAKVEADLVEEEYVEIEAVEKGPLDEKEKRAEDKQAEDNAMSDDEILDNLLSSVAEIIVEAEVINQNDDDEEEAIQEDVAEFKAEESAVNENEDTETSQDSLPLDIEDGQKEGDDANIDDPIQDDDHASAEEETVEAEDIDQNDNDDDGGGGEAIQEDIAEVEAEESIEKEYEDTTTSQDSLPLDIEDDKEEVVDTNIDYPIQDDDQASVKEEIVEAEDIDQNDNDDDDGEAIQEDIAEVEAEESIEKEYEDTKTSQDSLPLDIEDDKEEVVDTNIDDPIQDDYQASVEEEIVEAEDIDENDNDDDEAIQAGVVEMDDEAMEEDSVENEAVERTQESHALDSEECEKEEESDDRQDLGTEDTGKMDEKDDSPDPLPLSPPLNETKQQVNFDAKDEDEFFLTKRLQKPSQDDDDDDRPTQNTRVISKRRIEQGEETTESETTDAETTDDEDALSSAPPIPKRHDDGFSFESLIGVKSTSDIEADDEANDDDFYNDDDDEDGTLPVPSSPSHHRAASFDVSMFYAVHEDENTVIASNVSQSARERSRIRTRLQSSIIHTTTEPFKNANTFDVEWAEFSLLVRSLPQKNQQAVLSQMLIMTNGRTKSARFKLAKQVNKLIHQIAQEDAPSIPGMSNLKVNLQTFARLHREHRNLLSKRIFEAISQLYGDKEN